MQTFQHVNSGSYYMKMVSTDIIYGVVLKLSVDKEHVTTYLTSFTGLKKGRRYEATLFEDRQKYNAWKDQLYSRN